MILCGDLCFEEVEKSFEDLQVKKESVNASIKERHDVLNEAIKSLENIYSKETKSDNNKEILDEIKNTEDELNKLLEDLLK